MKLCGEYAEVAIQYYLSGRFAALRVLNPVSGNLFHHAVEMFLKACLQPHYSNNQLRKLSHNLPRLWEEAKIVLHDDALSVHDDLVKRLDKWEEVRYFRFRSPTETVQFVLTLNEMTTPPPSPADRAYRLTLEEFDAFMHDLIRATGIEDQVKSFFSSFDRLDAYELYNKNPLVGVPYGRNRPRLGSADT